MNIAGIKNVGTLVRNMVKQKLVIEKLEAALAKEKKLYNKMEERALELTAQQDILTNKTPLGSITVLTADVPTIENWNEFAKFVYRTKSLDLVQRRVSVTAWRERKEARDGKAIPGIGTYQRRSLRLTINREKV